MEKLKLEKVMVKSVDKLMERSLSNSCVFFFYQERIPGRVWERFGKKR